MGWVSAIIHNRLIRIIIHNGGGRHHTKTPLRNSYDVTMHIRCQPSSVVSQRRWRVKKLVEHLHLSPDSEFIITALDYFLLIMHMLGFTLDFSSKKVRWEKTNDRRPNLRTGLFWNGPRSTYQRTRFSESLCVCRWRNAVLLKILLLKNNLTSFTITHGYICCFGENWRMSSENLTSMPD